MPHQQGGCCIVILPFGTTPYCGLFHPLREPDGSRKGQILPEQYRQEFRGIFGVLGLWFA
jgi:hypothetical protein